MKHYIFNNKQAFFTIFFLISIYNFAQDKYLYSVDLTTVKNDQLKVELITPYIEQKTIVFSMPKIIPGTNRESDFGRFISEIKAFDAAGKELKVIQQNENQWEIKKAPQLAKITYWVEDIFDTTIENQIYRMSATNINEGENYVISTPGFFGYLEGLKNIPFQIIFTKPLNFYGTTSLIPISSTPIADHFYIQDYNELIDSPIMYNNPDITTLKIGQTEVLVSVYSSLGIYNSKIIAEKLKPLLKATEEYLGGKLPTKKYAFIFYFENPTKTSPLQGALEHNTSSFYYFPEYPVEQMLPHIIDIAAHEFLHIVTPLTLHSEEIQDFDYTTPKLSDHLWLYEGSTEYASDYVQVKYGLNSKEEFLEKLTQKITTSQKQFNDQLPFTELSREAAGKHADQYANVYEKGALIAAMLDIKLLTLSHGRSGLQDVIAQLSTKYGKDKPFKDEELFQEIEIISGLQVGDFFKQYVEGEMPLPLAEYFEKVGVIYSKEVPRDLASLGHIAIGFNQEENAFTIMDISQADEFGKQMGYQQGDLIYSINGQKLNPANAQTIIQQYGQNTKEGSLVKVEIGRKTDAGVYQPIELSASAIVNSVNGKISLKLSENPSTEQLALQSAWLDKNPVNPEDVKSIDQLMKTFYEVISGPAGERDWNRFFSLFSTNAQMMAITPNEAGNKTLVKMTPNEYKKANATIFLKNGFWENEYGRETSFYKNAASIASTYGYSFQKDTSPVQRGMNFINVAKLNGRWYITHVLWNHETAEYPIPKKFLNKT